MDLAKGRRIRIVFAFVAAIYSLNSWAVSSPAKEVVQLAPAQLVEKSVQFDKNLREIRLRLDVRNVVGPNGEGKISELTLGTAVRAASMIWSQCSISFVPRAFENVSTERLGIAFFPKGQEDLGRLAAALNPKGFRGAIPFTVAGKWKFYDSQTGVYPYGLGWVFLDGSRVSRIGAMISSDRLLTEAGPLIIAHELGHALSLPEGGSANNLMGVGNSRINPDQCITARSFAEDSLREFIALEKM